MSMELDQLLREEGLDAAGVEDALVWAHRRAAELLLDVEGDPELGPLLDGAAVVVQSEPSSPRGSGSTPRAPAAETRPLFNDLRGLQAAFLAEAEDEDADLPEVGAVLRAFKKGRTAGRSTKPAAPTSAVAEAPAAVVAADASAEASATQHAERPHVDAAVVVDAAEAASGGPTLAEDASWAAPAAAGGTGEAADASEVVPASEQAPLETEDAAPIDALADADAPADANALADAPTDADAPADAPADADAPPDEASADGAAAHGVPAPPEADLDPLAGIDFDDLPGVDEDEDDEDDHTHIDLPAPTLVAAGAAADDHELEGRTTAIPTEGADMTLPSMQAPLSDPGRQRPDGALPAGELTERARNPLLSEAEPTGDVELTAKAPNPLLEDAPTDASGPAGAGEAAEEPAEEIELLDDEDLLLVEEEPEEEPEWKQALKSAEGEGGRGDAGDDP